MKEKKSKRKSLFDDRRIVLLFSVVMAFVSWVVVAGFVQPGNDKVIGDIPIDITSYESTYKNYNLMIVTDLTNGLEGGVSLEGNGSTVRYLTNVDISLYLDYRGVTGPGTYDVPIRWEKVAAGDYDILDWGIGSDFEKSVKLEFDQVESKTLPISVSAPNVTAEEGFFRDANPAATPAELEISGPSRTVSKIEQAVALIEDEQVGSELLSFEAVPVLLYDADGHEVATTGLTLSTQTVNVEIPILQEGVLNLSISFNVGANSSLDTDWLLGMASFSVGSVHVAGRPSVIEKMPESYSISTIDVFEIYPGAQFEIPVKLPSDLRNRDLLESVTVTFDAEALSAATQEVPAENISIINVPKGYNIEVADESLANVAIVGDAAAMESLLPEDITIEVDAYSVNAVGRQEITARVLIFRSNRLFATGEYKVMCEVTEQAESEEG